MCGRFTLKAKKAEIADGFGVDLDDGPGLDPRYNIAPSQMVATIRLDPDSGRRGLDMLKWGLVPSWADDPKIGYSMINARAETVAEKPAFRSAFKARRCLVVADGFYEWMKVGKGKVPHFIRLKTDRPFALAGLWERWSKAGPTLETCTLITTAPNELMEPIHDRMPAILDPAVYDEWLDPATKDAGALKGLLRPYPADLMVAYPVSTMVNSPANDRPECCAPI